MSLYWPFNAGLNLKPVTGPTTTSSPLSPVALRLNDCAALRPLIQTVSKAGSVSTDVTNTPEATVTDKIVDNEIPQSFCAFTFTLPEMAPQLTVIEEVPCPATIDAPAGTVQL